MTSTDVSDIAREVTGIQISGPGLPLREEGGQNDGITMTVVRPDGSESEPIPTSILRDLPPAKDALFEASGYVDVPIVDGQATDELVIAFSGSIKYDATDPAGQALFARLRLGKDVDLRVAGFVATKAGGYKMAGVGTDNEREVVTGKIGVKVTDLFTLSPEQL